MAIIPIQRVILMIWHLTILGTRHHQGSMRKLKMDLGSLLAKGAGAGTIRQRNTVEQSISRSILKLEKLEDLHDRLLLCDRDPSLPPLADTLTLTLLDWFWFAAG